MLNPALQEFLPGHLCSYEPRGDLNYPVFYDRPSGRVFMGLQCVHDGSRHTMWAVYQSAGGGGTWEIEQTCDLFSGVGGPDEKDLVQSLRRSLDPMTHP